MGQPAARKKEAGYWTKTAQQAGKKENCDKPKKDSGTPVRK